MGARASIVFGAIAVIGAMSPTGCHWHEAPKLRPGEGRVALCEHHLQYAVSGYLTDLEFDEISGIAASLRHRGWFWVHNDSGDSARIFAVRSTGERLATFVLEGVEPGDWEDIAVAVGPAGSSAIFVADVGDNLAVRNEIRVHRFAEPQRAAGQQVVPASAIDTFRVRLPHGPRDIETLIVDGQRQEAFLVTKARYRARVEIYRFSTQNVLPSVAQRVAEIDLGYGGARNSGWMVMGGDIAPSGDRLVLILNYAVYYWHRRHDESVAQAMQRAPCAIPVLTGTGEAVAFAENGDIIVTGEGAGNRVHIFSDP